MPVTKELTELVEINPTRVDLVRTPASGFPILLMKSVGQEAETEPPAEPTSKETMTDETSAAPAAEPVTEDAPVEKSAEELMAEAVAKEVAPLVEVIKGLREELEAIKATPIPGGPAVTAPVAKETAHDSAVAKEIARFTRLADDTQDRELARYYADRAQELKGK